MAANPVQVDESARHRIDEEIAVILGPLEKEAVDRVNKRSSIEKRWLDDLRQFQGHYTAEIEAELLQAGKSTVYLNQTRPKTNAMEARLSDLLFPTDDKNWGIGPTPVPELTVDAEQAARAAAEASEAVADDPENPEKQQASAAADEQLKQFTVQLDEAKKRARAMEAEIEDNLTECNYSAQCREVIRDACKIGTGVMKGPVTDGKTRRTWVMGPGNVFVLQDKPDERPVFWRVDPWNFFPDMEASKPEDSDGFFERHLMNKKELRRLARQPGFNKAAIRDLLLTETRDAVPTYISQLRSITGDNTTIANDRYHVWEYHGTLDATQLAQIATLARHEKLAQIASDQHKAAAQQAPDPLVELGVVMWFCQGMLLKIGIHTLDSEAPLYSVFCLEKDEAGPFGFGIPFLMRDSQKSLAAAWRTLIDNMGLSSGPQIVINKDVITPAAGNSYRLEARKVWLRTGVVTNDKAEPFKTYDIPSHIADLLALVEASKKNIDEETSLPLIAQGDQSSQITKTAGGMSMLMNSVNIIFRRVVKNWDDDMTTPSIRRIYDYQMQFSKKDYIKGDYEVDARGTSVLLVREMQSANLMLFLNSYANHPTLGKFLKKEGLPGLRRLASVLMIPHDEIIKTDDEILKDEAEAAKNPPGPPPEIQKIMADLNDKEEARAHEKDMAYLERETRMMELAQTGNLTLDEIRAMLLQTRQEIDSKERMFAAEAAISTQEAEKDRQADKDADGEERPGSGGYFA
jgi:hypothetical protein